MRDIPVGLLIGAAGLGLVGAALWTGSGGLLAAGVLLIAAAYWMRW